jgi:hypothetical protein
VKAQVLIVEDDKGFAENLGGQAPRKPQHRFPHFALRTQYSHLVKQPHATSIQNLFYE